MVDEALKRNVAINGRRGRGGKNDEPRGDAIQSRLTTDPKGGTSVYTFPMDGSEGAKYPANTMSKKSSGPKDQVTPGKWKSKSCIDGKMP